MKVSLHLLKRKGSRYDLSNNRGISITSNFGKLFNKEIYNHLMKFVNEHRLICENQIGLRKVHVHQIRFSLSNQLLSIKKVFASFIDLRKAFDTV